MMGQTKNIVVWIKQKTITTIDNILGWLSTLISDLHKQFEMWLPMVIIWAVYFFWYSFISKHSFVSTISHNTVLLVLFSSIGLVMSFIPLARIGLDPKGLGIRQIDHRPPQQGIAKLNSFTAWLQYKFCIFLGIEFALLVLPILKILKIIYLHHWGLDVAIALSANCLVLILGHPIGLLSARSVIRYLFANQDDIKNSQTVDLPVWRKVWVDTLIPLWLLGAGKESREQFELHGHWRVNAYFTRVYRYWQYRSIYRFITQQRWLWMVVAGMLTLPAGFIILKLFDHLFHSDLVGQMKNAGGDKAANLVLFLLGTGVFYMVWLFRDQNTRWQIDNSRKDINLKDFQRLSEWAAGMHLPEHKITRTRKKIKTDNEESKVSKETSRATEYSESPHSHHALSQREGGESLQIAAIYQMSSFLNGEFGKYFQRPAFLLLTSIHQKLYSEIKQKFTDYFKSDTEGNVSFDRSGWTQHVKSKSQADLITALDAVLFSEHGRALRQHADDLPEMVLNCADTTRSMLKQPLELSHLNLSGIKAIGANLWYANLQGADLFVANLQGANLWYANLQGADLFGANLQGADLTEANLQGTDLRNANLQGADLSGTNLQGADLKNAKFQGADLSVANLQGADLFVANLQGASLRNANLQGAQCLNLVNYVDADWRGCKVENTLFAVANKSNTDSDIWVIDPKKTQEMHQKLKGAGLKVTEVSDIIGDNNAFNPLTKKWSRIEE